MQRIATSQHQTCAEPWQKVPVSLQHVSFLTNMSLLGVNVTTRNLLHPTEV